MIPIEISPVSETLRDARWRKVPEERRDDFDDCYVCGLPVDTKQPDTRWIRVIEGGSHAAEPKDMANLDPAGDMYCFPVGPECLRRQPDLRRGALSGTCWDVGFLWAPL